MLNPCANEQHQDNSVVDLRKNGLCFPDSRLRFILGVTAVVLGVLLIIAGLGLTLTVGGASVNLLLSGVGFLFLFLGVYLIRVCQIEKRKQQIEKGLKALEDSKKIKRETVVSEIADLEKEEKEKDAIIRDLKKKITDVGATAEKVGNLYVARQELLRKKEECLRNREESIRNKRTLEERLELTKVVLSLMDEERELQSQLSALESEKQQVREQIRQLTIEMTSMVQMEHDSLKTQIISDLVNEASGLEKHLLNMERKHCSLNEELKKLHGVIEAKSEKILQIRKDKQIRKDQEILRGLLRSKENLKEEMAAVLRSLDMCKMGFPEDYSVEPIVLDPISDEDLVQFAEEEIESWPTDLLLCRFLNDRISIFQSIPGTIVFEASGFHDVCLHLASGADREESVRAMQDVSRRAILDFHERYEPAPEDTEETLKISIARLEEECRKTREGESPSAPLTEKHQQIVKDLDRARGCLCNIQRSLGISYEGSDYREVKAELDRCNKAIQCGLSSISSISDQIVDNSTKTISASLNGRDVWGNVNVVCGAILKIEEELRMLEECQKANSSRLQSLLQQSALYSFPGTARATLCEELKALEAVKAAIIRAGSGDTVDIDGHINSKQGEIDCYDNAVYHEQLILEVRESDRNIREKMEAKQREMERAYRVPIFLTRNVAESLQGLSRETGVCLLVLDKLVQFCKNLTEKNNRFKCLQEDVHKQFMTSIIDRNRSEKAIASLKTRLESLSEEEMLQEEGILLMSQLSDQELERERCLKETKECIAANRRVIRTTARQVAKESLRLRKLAMTIDKFREKQDERIKTALIENRISVPDKMSLEMLSFDLQRECGHIVNMIDHCESSKIGLIGDKKKLEALREDCLKLIKSDPSSKLLSEKVNRLESDIKTIEQNIVLLDRDIQTHQSNLQLLGSLLGLFKERAGLIKAQKLLKTLQSELGREDPAVKSGGLEKILLDTVVALDREQDLITTPGGELLHWEARLEECETLSLDSLQDRVAQVYRECCEELRGTDLEIPPVPEDRSQMAAFLLKGMHTVIRIHGQTENNLREKPSFILALMSQLERRIKELSDEECDLKEKLSSTEISSPVDSGEEDDESVLEDLRCHLQKQDVLKKNLEESVQERVKIAEEFRQVYGNIRALQDNMSGESSLFLVEEGRNRLKEQQTTCFHKQQTLFSKMKELENSADLIRDRQKSCSGRLQSMLLSEESPSSLKDLEDIGKLVEEVDFTLAELEIQITDLEIQIQVIDRDIAILQNRSNQPGVNDES